MAHTPAAISVHLVSSSSVLHKLCKMVDRLDASIFLTENGIKRLIGFTGLIGSKARCDKSRVQLGLILPVFPCRLCKVKKTFRQTGKGSTRSHNRRTDSHAHAFDNGADLIKF